MKRFWQAVDWILILLFTICALPLLICIARAIARAMSEHP